jgi:hypothetical protein
MVKANKKIGLYIILILLLIVLICWVINKSSESFSNCNEECQNLGSIETNCLCMNCCANPSNTCDTFKKSLLQFLNTGDTLDCKIYNT